MAFTLPAARAVVNAMTIDVEDYFQVSAFDDVVSRTAWDGFESRVCRNTERILELFAEADVRGTFFVLAWVAERFPGLVRTIASLGHEIASHGYGHRLVYDLTPEEFRRDVSRAKRTLEDMTGTPVVGFRAPSYSITGRSAWALDVLVEEGYVYDASIFPIRHDRYGMPSAPRHPHLLRRPRGPLVEAPPSTVRWMGQNFPVAGGGYFRHLPAEWTRWGISRINRAEGCPAVFYLHPWEIDPEQPRIPTRLLTRLRHYRNLHKTEARLRRLLRDFSFGPLLSVLSPLPGRCELTILSRPTPERVPAMALPAAMENACV
jgi:polysaccharide deacetylase family protein (PEP-CTERM system associated)